MRARGFMAGLLGLAIPVACSAAGGDKGATALFGNGGSGNATGSTTGAGSTVGAGSISGAGSTLGSGGSTFFGTGGVSAGGSDASSCPRTVSKPEQITVYVDASYTDTVYSYSPIAIYIMQDRSSSMVGVLGDPSRWPNSQTAITDFVNDPSSSGLYVGLGAFPPYPSNTANDCTNDCKTPVVPIAALPGNAQSVINAYSTLTPPVFPPNFTPTECGLNGMVDACTQFKAQMQSAGTPTDCVGLLITDGAPDACNGSATALQGILSTAAAAGIKTFVLGLPGSDLTFLNGLAAAGGTTQAIDATAGSSQAIVSALNTVRSKVATQVTTGSVTTTNVISTKLPCDWGVPSGITPTKTNLEFTPDTGAAVEQIGHLPIPPGADPVTTCGTATGDAWYYDNEAAPTKVTVCPSTCDKIKAAANPTVDLIFGCDTVDVPIR